MEENKHSEGGGNYKWLNNQLWRETEKAREDWWREECRELEDLDKRGRSDLMYKKIKEITRTGRSTSNIDVGGEVKDKKGLMLTDPEEVRGRWREYVEELYDVHKKPKMEELDLELEEEVKEDSKGSELIEVELRGAMEDLKKGKLWDVMEYQRR